MKRFYDILKPGGFVGATLVTMGPQFWMLQNLGQSEKWRGYCKVSKYDEACIRFTI